MYEHLDFTGRRTSNPDVEYPDVEPLLLSAVEDDTADTELEIARDEAILVSRQTLLFAMSHGFINSFKKELLQIYRQDLLKKALSETDDIFMNAVQNENPRFLIELISIVRREREITLEDRFRILGIDLSKLDAVSGSLLVASFRSSHALQKIYEMFKLIPTAHGEDESFLLNTIIVGLLKHLIQQSDPKAVEMFIGLYCHAKKLEGIKIEYLHMQIESIMLGNLTGWQVMARNSAYQNALLPIIDSGLGVPSSLLDHFALCYLEFRRPLSLDPYRPVITDRVPLRFEIMRLIQAIERKITESAEPLPIEAVGAWIFAHNRFGQNLFHLVQKLTEQEQRDCVIYMEELLSLFNPEKRGSDVRKMTDHDVSASSSSRVASTMSDGMGAAVAAAAVRAPAVKGADDLLGKIEAIYSLGSYWVKQSETNPKKATLGEVLLRALFGRDEEDLVSSEKMSELEIPRMIFAATSPIKVRDVATAFLRRLGAWDISESESESESDEEAFP